jgi:hypothetical protein
MDLCYVRLRNNFEENSSQRQPRYLDIPGWSSNCCCWKRRCAIRIYIQSENKVLYCISTIGKELTYHSGRIGRHDRVNIEGPRSCMNNVEAFFAPPCCLEEGVAFRQTASILSQCAGRATALCTYILFCMFDACCDFIQRSTGKRRE